jgi:predicted nucleic acid-binding protein
MIVLDNSVVIDWLVEPAPQPGIDELIEQGRDGFAVPSLFWSELVYALGKHQSWRRINADFKALCIRRTIALNPLTDMEAAAPGAVFDRVLDLMNRHRLTVYDAVYLELAQRRGDTLATLDKALAEAARAMGLEVLPAS